MHYTFRWHDGTDNLTYITLKSKEIFIKMCQKCGKCDFHV